MKYEILDAQGKVANVIIATPGFVAQHYAGSYREVVDAQVAANPDVIVSTTQPITKLEFLSLFTDEEIGDILDGAKTNKKLAVFVKKLELAGDVLLSDPRTINAINALEAGPILGAGRAARIISGKAPL